MGVRVRTVRALRGLTQKALGQLAGRSRNYLSGLEHGERPLPRPDTVRRLAQALGVTEGQLRGCEPLAAPEMERAQGPAQEQAAAEPEPAGPARPAQPLEGDPALGLTSLLTLPPGATVLQRTNPDGSVELYIRIPNGPPAGHCRAGGRNHGATGEG
jgi:transcriptional regulator with XRE-family HTH domain